MYLAPIIDSVLESKKDTLLGRPTYFYITDVLNRAFKKTEPFIFRFELYKEYEKNEYYVTGLFDMSTGKRHVILNFSKLVKTFNITPGNWSQFKFDIAQTCQHETIHRDQWAHRAVPADVDKTLDFRNITGTLSDEKLYLADIDEIDAYGHDIAMEIVFKYPGKDPYQILKTIDTRKKVRSYIYYKKTFSDEDWGIIKNRLLKKVFLWLPQVH